MHQLNDQKNVIQTAVYIAERFVIHRSFSDLENPRFIIESGFKSRAGNNGAHTVDKIWIKSITVRALLLPALDLKPLSIINRGFLGPEKFQCNINRSAV